MESEMEQSTDAGKFFDDYDELTECVTQVGKSRMLRSRCEILVRPIIKSGLSKSLMAIRMMRSFLTTTRKSVSERCALSGAYHPKNRVDASARKIYDR